MQVLHIISNKDNSGGTIAALGLHRALQQHGLDSSVLSTGALEGAINGKGYRRFGGISGRVQQFFLRLEKQLARPGWFNPMDKLLTETVLQSYTGIVHIHVTHVAQISFELLSQLASGNKVFWTLHDLWPLTGKCIHPVECQKYLTNCFQCPKLEEYPKLTFDNSPFLHQKKKNFITQHKIHFISPSKWITDETKKYINHIQGNISTIPHAINTEIFKPQDQELLRRKYHLPSDGDIILFPQGRWDDIKKGQQWYTEIKSYLEKETLNRRIYLVRLIGNEMTLAIVNSNLSEITLPATTEKATMSDYYNLCDVTVSLSEIETFGLCVAESLACHKPVLARKAKGVSELLKEEAIVNNSETLANFITEQKWLYINYDELFSSIRDKNNTLNWARKHEELYGS